MTIDEFFSETNKRCKIFAHILCENLTAFVCLSEKFVNRHLRFHRWKWRIAFLHST